MQIICRNSHFRLAKPFFSCILRVPASYPWLTGTEHKLTTDKKVMKTIAILALTAAALVSCQQQQQQQVVPTVEPAPVVAPIKK